MYTVYEEVTKETVSNISQVTADNSFKAKFGDVLFGGSGEAKEDIGKSTVFQGERDTYIGGDIVIFRPFEDYGSFLGYATNSNHAREQKRSSAQGDAVVHIYKSALESLEIAFPPTKQEELEIAQTLTTLDAELRTLETQLTQARALKAGMMGDLLTGRVRLV